MPGGFDKLNFEQSVCEIDTSLESGIMLSERDEEFEFMAQVTAEYGIAKGFSIIKPDFVGKYMNRKLVTEIRIL